MCLGLCEGLGTAALSSVWLPGFNVKMIWEHRNHGSDSKLVSETCKLILCFLIVYPLSMSDIAWVVEEKQGPSIKTRPLY